MLWAEIATGFTGALTLVFAYRALMRHLGRLPSAEAYFAPRGGCEAAVLRELQGARAEILVLAQRFATEALTGALVEAKKRGVHVDVVFDPGMEKERAAELKVFLDQGLAPSIDPAHPTTRTQVIVIDQRTVITGSYDFTRKGEEECAADVVILKGHPETAQAYRQHFLAHRGHARAAGAKVAEGAAKKAA